MEKTRSRLEFLPNEYLLLCFQYFNAKDLFHAFYNLNSRFNQLLQSFYELRLVYQMKNIQYNDQIYPYYVYTLIINTDNDYINVNFQHFPNIHRLKLDAISKQIISQFKSISLPYLEHLTLYHPGM